jgi:predicted amidohydrolase YtcJ
VILHNGPVYTMDPRLPQVRALSIAGDAIAGGVDVREGATDTVGHERVDLEGRCVLPGFCDSHVHFLDWALGREELDLGAAGSMAETLVTVGEAVTSGDGWLRGHGWLEEAWPDGPPTAAALDTVTGERPVALWAHDHHTLWVNSAALRAASQEGGGIVRERDAWDFPLPARTPLEQSRAVRSAMAAANARGVVAVHDYQRDRGRGLWQRLDGDRRLTLRVHMSLPAERIEAAEAMELRTGFGSELLRVGPVKAFMDGTLGSSTAWMLDGSGMVLTAAAEMADIARASAASGLSVAVHAIGDGANRAVLDALEETREAWEGLPVPPRIEHVQCIDDADLGRLADLGITASMQPVHQRSDRDLADRLWADRARCGYRWRDLLDSGAHLAFGSDAPIEDLDPLAGIDAAVNRDWYPEQRLDVADAVLAFTAGGAAAVGEQRRRGLLLPGYAADLVVLDTDIIAHPDRIADANVVATMLAGRWVHGRPPW